MFWLSIFFQRLQNNRCKVNSPTVFSLPLCSRPSTMNKLSREKQQLRGQSRRTQLQQPFSTCEIALHPRCTQYLPISTFKIFLLKVGSLQRVCSSAVHHGLVIVPLLGTDTLQIGKSQKRCFLNVEQHVCCFFSHFLSLLQPTFVHPFDRS